MWNTGSGQSATRYARGAELPPPAGLALRTIAVAKVLSHLQTDASNAVHFDVTGNSTPTAHPLEAKCPFRAISPISISSLKPENRSRGQAIRRPSHLSGRDML
jgi:hypothetical protein